MDADDFTELREIARKLYSAEIRRRSTVTTISGWVAGYVAARHGRPDRQS